MENGPSLPLVFYTPRQVFVAALVGGPMAGAWFASKNHAATSNKAHSRKVLVATGLITILLFPLLIFLPDKIPHLVIPLGYSWGFFYFTKTSLQRGGELGMIAMHGWSPWLKLLGISICWLAATIAVWIAISFLGMLIFPKAFLD